MAVIPTSPENLNIAHVYVILLNLIKTLTGFSMMFAVTAIVWGGIKIVSSGGNEEKVTSGKNIVIYATVGMITIMVSWVAVSQVLRLIGAKCPYDQPSITALVAAAPSDDRAGYIEQLKNAINANPDCATKNFSF